MWHYRLDYLPKSYLEKAAKVKPELRNAKFNNSLLECEICRKAKHKQGKLPQTIVQFGFNELMSLIYSDLMGLITPSIYKYGNTYIITFINDYTRYAWAYPMENKTDEAQVYPGG